MFRTSNRMTGEPMGVLNTSPKSADTAADGGLIWKPNLRRIKRGLFPGKDGLRGEGGQLGDNYTTLKKPANAESQQTSAGRTRALTSPELATTSRDAQPISLSFTEPSREKPKGPRLPKDSRGFTFLRRTLSRSSKSQGDIADQWTPGRSRNTPQLEKVSEDLEHQKQKPLPWIPKHAASDFSKQSEQRTPERERVPIARPKTSPYIPQHAASDFTKLNVQRQPSQRVASKPLPHAPKHTGPDVSELAIQQAMDPNSYIGHISPVNHVEPVQEEASNDYQIFLAQSRLAAARTFNLSGVISPNKPTPQTTEIMNQLTENHRLAMAEKRKSMSHQSTMSKGGGSFLERVGSYVRPEPAETTSPAPILEHPMVEEKSINETYGTEEQNSRNNDKRWSTLANSTERGSILFMDPNKDMSAKTRRRKRRMPTAPGLKKFNKAVDKGRIY